MTQHEIVSHILRDMKMQGLIDPEYVGEARIFLDAVFVAGWEQGRLIADYHSNKKIGQYSREGKLMSIFRSQKEAARKTGFTAQGINYAMRRDKPTKQGWIWKYI